jgi:Ca2+-binding RTX toxin-like protein
MACTGADILQGNAGNDTYMVDNSADSVQEANGGGKDTVKSTVDYTLADNVENLILVGTAINGTGNGLDNKLTGNTANNVLDGGAGGADIFGGRHR